MEEVVPVTNAIKGCPTRWLRDETTGLVTNKVYADGKGSRYDYTPDARLATRTWARGIVTASLGTATVKGVGTVPVAVR